MMVARQDDPTPEFDVQRARDFYTRLRDRITGWLAERKVNPTLRSILLLVPDLFALMIRLITDPRIGRWTKVQLIATASYVMLPIDLVPDFLLPLGQIDDAVAIALVLGRVLDIMGEAGDDILREHWAGEGDVLQQIRKVAHAGQAFLNGRVIRGLRRLFASPA